MMTPELMHVAADASDSDRPVTPVADALERLREFGTEREVGGNAAFRLDGDRCWITLAGRIEVFGAPLVHGRAGRRTHLFRVEVGQPLFSIDVGDGPVRAFIAVGATGTRVLELPLSVVREMSCDPVHAPAIGSLIEQWIESLCSAIAPDVGPTRCAELVPDIAATFPAATTVRCRTTVGWVTHRRGISLLLGEPRLVVNGDGFTPLSRRLWLELRDPAELLLLTTNQVPDPDAWWSGVDRLHGLVIRCIDQADQREHTSLRARLHRKAIADGSALRSACGRLIATIQPRRRGARAVIGTAPDGAGDPQEADALFEACLLVADVIDVQIRRPPTNDGAPKSPDPLGGIMRASRVRTRKVVLRGPWWEHDHGPLLGMVGEDKRPVALMHAGDGYILVNPQTGSSRVVDEIVAATLQPFGFTFYRPFPDAALTIKDVVRFGLFGAKRDIIMVVALGLVSTLLGMVPSIATGMLFNDVIPGAQRSQLLQLTLVLVACSTTVIAFNLARGIALLRIEGRTGAAVQAAVWDRLLSLPLPFFRPFTSGDLASRAMSIDAIRQAISGSTVTAILGGIFSMGNFFLMFHYSATMAFRGTLLIAAALALTALGILLQLGPQRGVLRVQTKVSGLMLQLLSSVGKLRVAGAEMKAFGLWAERFSEQRTLQYQTRRIGIRVGAVHSMFPLISSLVLFWSGVSLMAAGQGGLRTGDFLAFFAAFSSCSGALLSTFSTLLATLNVIPQYELAKPILEARPEVDHGKSDPGTITGDVSLQHVTFRYQPDGPLVLRDVTVRIDPGQFIALVGPSGSGKSTILRLLLGFEAPEAGAVYYDGQELTGLDVQAVRRQLGVVLQSGRLMGGDIFTNISGATSVTIEEAWEAARMAGFADDVNAMPMGMHTVIGESGGSLSGGQRQRLLIARAIVHRPRIVLFDEATSALDNHTQAIVSRSLEQLQATRIVVAHRLSTIRNADRIYVIHRGRVEEDGTYDELMRTGHLFNELATRQMA